MRSPPPCVVRHQSELGYFEHVSRPPHPRLAGAVHGYVGYSHRVSQPVRQREVAQDRVTLILGFGTPLRVCTPGYGAEDHHSFVAAMTDVPAVIEHGGALHGVQVDLSPLGAHMLLGVPMRELGAVVVPLEDVLGSAAPRLVERLVDAPSWEDRFSLLDVFIAARIAQAQRPSPDVAWAWRRLVETGGQLQISSLASELGCSSRHLATRFQEQIGPAPKTAARILRFRRTLELLSSDDGGRFAEIAHTCGYYDQPHMNRDFLQLAGTTPSEYLASRLPDGFGVQAR